MNLDKFNLDITEGLSKRGLARILPNGITIEKFTSLAAMSLINNESLTKAYNNQNLDMPSLFNELIKCARHNLFLDNFEATMTGFWSKKKSKLVPSMMIMAAGYKKIVLESGYITQIESFVVYQNEKFHIEYNENGVSLHWIPNFDNCEIENVRLAYARAKDIHGNIYIQVSNLSNIFASRDKSNYSSINDYGKQFINYSSPWHLYPHAMYALVPLRRLCRTLPIPNSSAINSAINEEFQTVNEVNEVNEKTPVPEKKQFKNSLMIQDENPYSNFHSKQIAIELDKINSNEQRIDLKNLIARCKDLFNSGELHDPELLREKIQQAKERLKLS